MILRADISLLETVALRWSQSYYIQANIFQGLVVLIFYLK